MIAGRVMLVVGLIFPGITVAADFPSLSKTDAERAVVDALPAWQGKRATIVEYLDLTGTFRTAPPSALVVAQMAGPPPVSPQIDGHGPLSICFLVANQLDRPHCTSGYWQSGSDGGMDWFAAPYSLREVRVVHAGRDKTRPLLLVGTCSEPGGDGNCSVRTALYAYASWAGGFGRVFVNDSDGTNNNQETRFIDHGPLLGDVFVDYPTSHAPYRYWIEVYAPGNSGRYARILRYRSHTGYGDGNPLPVIDSEMPAILERLGLWKPGDALPVPGPLPANCGRLILNRGEEWCRNLCVNYGGNACARFTNAKPSEGRDR